MKPLIYVLFLFFSFSAFAQYPFEKYPALKYTKIPFTIIQANKKSPKKAVALYKNYRVEMRETISGNDSCNLLLYFKNKLIKKTGAALEAMYAGESYPLLVGDINGDGLLDFKFSYPNNGSGLAGSISWKIYFFNKGNNQFREISFGDFYENISGEYDFNHDGTYEIVSQSHVAYKNHSYWVFNLYNYVNGNLINVNRKYHYPIIIQMLYKDNYKITDKISRQKMEQFSLKFPEEYIVQ